MESHLKFTNYIIALSSHRRMCFNESTDFVTSQKIGKMVNFMLYEVNLGGKENE